MSPDSSTVDTEASDELMTAYGGQEACKRDYGEGKIKEKVGLGTQNERSTGYDEPKKGISLSCINLYLLFY